MNGNLIMTVAIVVVICLVLIIALSKSFHRDSSMKPKYDERQMAIRGRGYMLAFYIILIVMCFLPALINDETKKLLGDLVNFIPMAIGIPVHVSYCIWNNAYIELNLNYKKWVIFSIVAGLFNMLVGFSSIHSKGLIRDGSLNFNLVNVYIGILLIIVLIELVIKNAIDRKEDEEDEESEA